MGSITTSGYNSSLKIYIYIVFIPKNANIFTNTTVGHIIGIYLVDTPKERRFDSKKGSNSIIRKTFSLFALQMVQSVF